MPEVEGGTFHLRHVPEYRFSLVTNWKYVSRSSVKFSLRLTWSEKKSKLVPQTLTSQHRHLLHLPHFIGKAWQCLQLVAVMLWRIDG